VQPIASLRGVYLSEAFISLKRVSQRCMVYLSEASIGKPPRLQAVREVQ
jgi:hypothetical protein